MKKTIVVMCFLISLCLIGVGVYGIVSDGDKPLNTKDVEWIPEWAPEVNIPAINIPAINKQEIEDPIDTDFENMEEFDLSTKVDKEIKSDGVVSGIVPVGEIKDDRGNLVQKGVDTNIECSNVSPNTVYVPNIGLYSPISNKNGWGNFDEEGYFNLPDRYDVSTQWTDGAKITDDSGNTLLAAHRTYSGRYGVFNSLVNIKEGAVACVSDSDGNLQKYVIESLKHYKKDELDQTLFDNANEGEKRLTMITCGGKLLKKSTGGYTFESNVVAVFKAIE